MKEFHDPFYRGPAERVPVIDFSEAVVNHAAELRTDWRMWLLAMEKHINDGDITPEGLEAFVGDLETKETQEIIKNLQIQFPKATNLFTYIGGAALFKVFDGSVGQWPSQYPLNGIDIYPGTGGAYFKDLDISRAQIDFAVVQDRQVSLLQDQITDYTGGTWEQSDNDIGTCVDAEQKWGNTLSNADKDRHIPFTGVVFMDKGKALAALKFRGDDSLLGLRTVTDTEGAKQFFMGMIYAMGDEAYEIIRDQINKLVNEVNDKDNTEHLDHKFLTVEISDLAKRCKEEGIPLAKNPMRFISPRAIEHYAEGGDLYPLMRGFIQWIESGRIETLPLFREGE